MFNPEKLLGGMLRSGMRGRGVGSLVSGGAALGLLGVAMEAVEHYMNKAQSGSQSTSTAIPPPAPGSGALAGRPVGGPPPAPPGARATAAPPPSPAAGVQETTTSQADAVLLIRAMIAAANADGVIDAQERGRIMEKLKTVDLSKEEQQFIVNELLAPQEAQRIVEGVRNPEMARQVYAASLVAITVDCQAEQQYLMNLAEQLGLDAQTIDAIHQQLGK
jgi:uncharacterized membrane protein YebE (DUF533 family)